MKTGKGVVLLLCSWHNISHLMLGIKNSAFKYLKTKTYFGLAVGFNGNNIKFQFLVGFLFFKITFASSQRCSK
jgi:hypothetical protein